MQISTALRSVVAAAVLALTAACSTGGSGGATPTGGSTGGDALARVQKAGVLRVGTEGTYRPFSFHAEGSGKLTGFDVDVVTAVAGKLGVKPQFAETQWDAIFAGLTAGRFDVIANQVSITPDRTAAYLFSTPYTYSTGVVVVPVADTSITSFASLNGKTTAQSLTSNWYTLAKDSGAKVQAVEGWAQSVALVEQGRVDATINDKLTFLDHQKTTGDRKLKIAAETTERSESAMAFTKDSATLVAAVDDALAALAADGTLATISTTYFGEDVTK